jgi:hypothetical protein
VASCRRRSPSCSRSAWRCWRLRCWRLLACSPGGDTTAWRAAADPLLLGGWGRALVGSGARAAPPSQRRRQLLHLRLLWLLLLLLLRLLLVLLLLQTARWH